MGIFIFYFYACTDFLNMQSCDNIVHLEYTVDECELIAFKVYNNIVIGDDYFKKLAECNRKLKTLKFKGLDPEMNYRVIGIAGI